MRLGIDDSRVDVVSFFYLLGCTVMEYAIIQTGGKQLKVCVGDVVSIESLGRGADHLAPEGTVTFDKVLLAVNGKDTKVGTPYLGNAKVEGTICRSYRARKIVIIKFIRRKRHCRKKGHRQNMLTVKIDKVEVPA